ncbi:hypothetical protein RRV45_01610 [Bacillus sp. DTU_2020_1000418_1_SI_GHA_SEK_038]|uniref:hypothetical protein n=1 Tax=Bacillus sp. DTU_2020_1000418_1_SI_GHA_SEK_038 TaxID=3077585 RepID=UPI0028EB3D33|nr:hypothetical protein [Bacillus sp. DTU_2020_1000418_1_SI_GHA_SEK_038]WNS75773.1 hypothetical protein RRV45_01610 [Bacillus sp. DTU_2020_1000418_1_SI_GHA_SEK_038]
MKKYVCLLFLFFLMLAGCSNQEEQLTRVDAQKVNEEGKYEEEVIITDKEMIDLLKNSFKEVKWEPNTKAEMSRNEDVLATLFYTFDKNMPERLYEYRIWFNSNDSTTIISNHEKEGYGTLDGKNSKIIKNVFLSKD